VLREFAKSAKREEGKEQPVVVAASGINAASLGRRTRRKEDAAVDVAVAVAAVKTRR